MRGAIPTWRTLPLLALSCALLGCSVSEDAMGGNDRDYGTGST